MICEHPDCTGGGVIDETGFCTVCYHAWSPAGAEQPPAAPQPAPRSCGMACTRDSDEFFELADGLVRMPVLRRLDPTTRLIDESTLAGPPPRLRPGEVVGKQYAVLGALAHSGFGWVYLAKDQHLERYVALKGLINVNDQVAWDMAVRERQYLTRLNHPNIVRIYNAVTHREERTGEDAGYIVMDYIYGPSLDEVRTTALLCGQDCGTLSLEQILGIGHEILSALGYLHAQGLLYCDMKPANTMRGADRITVVDLGGMSEIAAHDTDPIGTPPYEAPPEEIKTIGATVKSDIHTVGRTLETLYREACRAPDAVPAEATASFLRLLRRAFDERYDQRFASAAEMTEQLTGVLRELLSLRGGVEHAATSTLFAPTAEVIDGGLGAVPPLQRWTGLTPPGTVCDPPPLRSVALGLPIPRPDPADVATRYLGGGIRHDPRDLIARVGEDGEESAELLLRACRAHIELGDGEQARSCLDTAVELLLDTPGAWRLAWYRGLLTFAEDRIPEAAVEFGEVCDFWPGEVAPKLALALCEERTGGRPEPLFTAVWRRDRSQASAAFGLARLRLRRGDRAGAADILDQVPLMSPHRDAARIAAARVFTDPLPAHASPDDVAMAAERLPRLRLDGGAADGEARRRMTAVVRQAEVEAAEGDDPVAAERLERAYRELAAQARTARDQEILVDLANRVRPRTLLTWRR